MAWSLCFPRGNLGLERLENAAILVAFGAVGSHQLLLLAFLVAKGDKVESTPSEAFDHLFRLAGVEAGEGVEAFPSGSVRGLGAGQDGLHGVSHVEQHVFSLGGNELELIVFAAVVATVALKDIDIQRLGADGIPSHGKGASLVSSGVHAGLDGVFLNRDAGKSNLASSSGSIVLVTDLSFRFQPIDLLGVKTLADVFFKSANAVAGHAIAGWVLQIKERVYVAFIKIYIGCNSGIACHNLVVHCWLNLHFLMV